MSQFIDNITKQFKKTENFLPGAGFLSLRLLRKKSLENALHLGAPCAVHPTWKKVLLQPFLEIPFKSPLHPHEPIDFTDVGSYFVSDPHSISLVFINGYYAPYLSNHTAITSEVTISTLAQIAKNQPEFLQELMTHSVLSKQFFHQINNAFTSDGAFIIIPENYLLLKPIYLYHFILNENIPSMINHQTHIIISNGASATITEHFFCLSESPCWLNAQTFVSCEKSANLKFYRYHKNSVKTYHFNTINCSLFTNSQLTLTDFTLGGAYHRHETTVEMRESNAQFGHYGFMLPDPFGHIDWISRLSHLAPYCHSQQHIRSVIGNECYSSFLGSINVAKIAQKTVTRMTNHNLLLGTKGRADSAPWLEIQADDVQCSHAANVSQLDDAILFYLRTRGLSLTMAKHLLVNAFLQEITNSIDHELLKNLITHHINEQLKEIFTDATQ